MLRPVCLLPTARLTPARGLLTPRSDDRVSPSRLGPATRRTGAYRGGTCTRWKRAARRLRPDFLSFACFATHHGKRSYLPLALLQASHRGKVFLGLTVPAAREVVLKVVRRGVGGDLEGQ